MNLCLFRAADRVGMRKQNSNDNVRCADTPPDVKAIKRIAKEVKACKETPIEGVRKVEIDEEHAYVVYAEIDGPGGWRRASARYIIIGA